MNPGHIGGRRGKYHEANLTPQYAGITSKQNVDLSLTCPWHTLFAFSCCRFLEELLQFDDSELPESTLNLVEPYLKKASFQPQNMQRKTNSAAAASLCKWVRGVVR